MRQLSESIAPVFEIFELVVAGAAGAEEDGVAGGGDGAGDFEGGGEIAASVDGGRAEAFGLAHGRRDGGAGLADAEDGLGALAEGGVEGIERKTLVVPPYYLDHGFWREGGERGGGGFGNGGDGIVVVADAAVLVNQLEAMGEAAEVGDGFLRIIPWDVEGAGGGEGGLGVELIVGAGDAEDEGFSIFQAEEDDFGVAGVGES